jgi:hypothetical protein
LNAVLADRAITITMRQAASKAKANREVVPNAPEFRKIRSMGYRLALVGWPAVVTGLGAVRAKQDEFRILSGRRLELYRPLIALGVLAGAHGDGGMLSALSAFVQREHATREPLLPEEAALFGLLEKRLQGTDSIVVYGADLLSDLSPYVSGAKAATNLLKRFFDPRAKTRRGVPFQISREDFEGRARQHGYVLASEAAGAGQPRGEPGEARVGQADDAAGEVVTQGGDDGDDAVTTDAADRHQD